MGHVLQAGQGQNPARQAAAKGGIYGNDAVEAVYDVRVLNVTPEHSVAEQDEFILRPACVSDHGKAAHLHRRLQPRPADR